MTNAQPPRRPRPGPASRPVGLTPAAERPPVAAPGRGDASEAPPALPAAIPGGRGRVVVGEETLRVPGFAALLHRHPRLTQRGGIGAVVGGILLFVVAGATTPLADAHTSTPRAAARHLAPAAARDTRPAAAPTADIPAAPVIAPVHSVRKAPVTHGVISGLAANGIPRVALNAYRVAAARMGNVQPNCGIDWALLAGIGREESDHGRFGGAVLHADGVSTPKIIGPALDGKTWDRIPAPGNGVALDGDAVYAHALGPMQFIPSTWAIYGADATGDGRADIFNINDAALGAARYLCAAGGDLRSHAGQVRAVLAYNHNDQYLAQVLALADAYRRGVPVSGIPVGITTGALPTITDTGYIPPANPGAPTAVDHTGGKKTSPKSHGGAAGSTAPAKGHPGAPAAAGSSKPSSGSSSGGNVPGVPGTSPTSSSGGSGGSGRSGGTGSSPAAPSPTTTCNAVQQLLGCKG